MTDDIKVIRVVLETYTVEDLNKLIEEVKREYPYLDVYYDGDRGAVVGRRRMV